MIIIEILKNNIKIKITRRIITLKMMIKLVIMMIITM